MPIRSITYTETNTPATDPVTTLVRNDQPVAMTPRPAPESLAFVCILSFVCIPFIS